ncbi:hypothetical protein MRX96_013287 [Rhipicephalus microplus]
MYTHTSVCHRVRAAFPPRSGGELRRAVNAGAQRDDALGAADGDECTTSPAMSTEATPPHAHWLVPPGCTPAEHNPLLPSACPLTPLSPSPLLRPKAQRTCCDVGPAASKTA